MDREQFREQITQRYVTGKALDGASLDDIAKGMVDPVEQMNYVTGQSNKRRHQDSSEQGPWGVIFFLLIIALALFSGFIKLLF